jgi:hypothetical protein
MDPQSTWDEIVKACQNDKLAYSSNVKYGEFYQLVQDLAGWLERGGFSPSTDVMSEMGQGMACYSRDFGNRSYYMVEKNLKPGQVLSGSKIEAECPVDQFVVYDNKGYCIAVYKMA